MTGTEADKHIVVRFFEVFSSGDYEKLLAMLDDAGSWWVSGKLPGVSGRYSKAEFTPILIGTKALYKGGILKITPVSMVAEAGKVAVEASGSAELHDGRRYAPEYHFLFKLQNGKITEVKEYMDTHYAKAMFFPG